MKELDDVFVITNRALKRVMLVEQGDCPATEATEVMGRILAGVADRQGWEYAGLYVMTVPPGGRPGWPGTLLNGKPVTLGQLARHFEFDLYCSPAGAVVQ